MIDRLDLHKDHVDIGSYFSRLVVPFLVKRRAIQRATFNELEAFDVAYISQNHRVFFVSLSDPDTSREKTDHHLQLRSVGNSVRLAVYLPNRLPELSRSPMEGRTLPCHLA